MKYTLTALLLLACIYIGCIKETQRSGNSSYYFPPPKDTVVLKRDSVLDCISLNVSKEIFKESDTAGNYIWAYTFYTETGGRYRYVSPKLDGRYKVKYVGNGDFIDTSGNIVQAGTDWVEWAFAFPVNEKIWDSVAFIIQNRDSTFRRLYLKKETLIVASMRNNLNVFMSKWYNKELQRLQEGIMFYMP